MWIANRQIQETYENELESLEQRHQQSLMEIQFRKPVPIELQFLSEDSEPLKFGKIIVMPGTYYGYDDWSKEIAIHPDDVGVDGVWVEVPAPAKESNGTSSN